MTLLNARYLVFFVYEERTLKPVDGVNWAVWALAMNQIKREAV